MKFQSLQCRATKRHSGSEMMRGASILKTKKEDRAEVASQAQSILKTRTSVKASLEPSPVESEEWSEMGYDSDVQLQVPEDIAEEADKKYLLPYFTSALFATILEDTLSSLRILGECNTQTRIRKTLDDMPALWSRKHGVHQPTVVDELQGVAPENLASDAHKLYKLEDDRKCFNELAEETYKRLTQAQGFHSLVQYVDSWDEREQYMPNLIEDEAKNKITLRECRRQLRQQRVYCKKTAYEAAVKIEDLVLQTEDINDMTTIRGNMVTRWQVARTEQHSETIRQKEATHLDRIVRHKYKYDHEQRAHTEMELIIDILINEALQEIENCMEKYDTDIEQIDLKVQIRKSEYLAALDKRQLMEHKIEHHDKEIRRWMEFKADREEQRKYQEKMHRSAAVVQAWWRGLLVRLQMGPYRPRKGKGKEGRRRASKTTT